MVLRPHEILWSVRFCRGAHTRIHLRCLRSLEHVIYVDMNRRLLYESDMEMPRRLSSTILESCAGGHSDGWISELHEMVEDRRKMNQRVFLYKEAVVSVKRIPEDLVIQRDLNSYHRIPSNLELKNVLNYRTDRASIYINLDFPI